MITTSIIQLLGAFTTPLALVSAVPATNSTPIIQLLGAAGFGILIGWYVYYINRNRKADVQLSDLVTVIGVIGGGAVLALFPAQTDLFGAYGIGLFLGFFGYFLTLIILVRVSKNFKFDWFLDGRCIKPGANEYFAGGRAMDDTGTTIPS